MIYFGFSFVKLNRKPFLPIVCSFLQAPQSPERLRCYYKTGHPLCTIKRCPIEVVFTNPDIMILRQIMTDAEIDKVIRISKPLVRTMITIRLYYVVVSCFSIVYC